MRYADATSSLIPENEWIPFYMHFLHAFYFSVIQDCEYILHVASPWPIVADESTIQVAVDGTMNVLKAATQCQSVKKIVLTSSCAAVNGKKC